MLCEEQYPRLLVELTLQALSPLIHRKEADMAPCISLGSSNGHRSVLLLLLCFCLFVGLFVLLVCLHLNGGSHTHQVSALPPRYVQNLYS